MEDIHSPCSTFPLLHHHQPPPPSPLQSIVQSQRERWDYAIFWQASPSAAAARVLSWGNGYYHGANESEWFYMASITRSFEAGDDLLCRALSTASNIWLVGHHQLNTCGSDRAKEAQLHGIKTLVFVATPSGVVELGSSDSIKHNSDLINLISTTFNHLDNRKRSSSPESRGSDEDKLIPPPRERKTARGSGEGEGITPENHVAAERKRREKLNQRFYALRSAVPNVSRMDKASLLADAVDYINGLKSRINILEQQQSAQYEVGNFKNKGAGVMMMEIEVKILGSEALIRAESRDVDHPCSRVMNALRDLELEVSRASVWGVTEIMFQDILIKLPHAVCTSDQALKTAILTKIEID